MDNDDIVKEVAVETTKQVAKDVYIDAVKPVAKDVGGILGAITGFFNHVVLYPLKKLNSRYEQKAIAFQREMERKYNSIPKEQQVDPRLHIVGPAMESLKYRVMEDDLAEMYSNLLISDMDSRTQADCSPSFVKIIEQMTPIEARVFKDLCEKLKIEDIGICVITIKSLNLQKIYEADLPSFFTTYSYEGCDEWDICKIVFNLQRLGLIELSYPQWLDISKYEPFIQSPIVQNRLNELNENNVKGIKAVISIKGLIRLTEFSKAFAKVCLRV